ncbi:helix-turn-helix domain-containing protein [Lactiplantibacillus plantarum]|uniref:helix-turn-helix domain-containing protein n=1 Tax=Lactiplantibacillus plantarum TaxID=1590 RepID=UPI0040362084
MNADNTIALQIKSLRNKFGWSQSQLADKLSVSKQSISNWETGLKVPRMGALQKMSDLFDVSIGYITDGDSNENIVALDNRSDSYVIKTNAIMKELNEMYQRRVYSYAKEQYDNQKMAFPDTLAAHQADSNHKISDQEAKDISDYLDGEIDKYNSDKR